MRRLLPIVFLLLLSSGSARAKDWRGILPMHSPREHVIALLGPPPQPPEGRTYTLHPGRSIYFLDEGEVYITFADEDFLKQNNCPVITAGTVVVILVIPKEDLPVASLNLDEKKFRKFDPSTPPGIGFEGFIDDKEGLVIRAYEGKVKEMVYFESSVDRARCPGFRDYPENLVRTGVGCVIKFDLYGNLRFSDEKARLDNFAIQLSSQKNMRGYIIAYAGRKATAAEALIRANRARDYLINIRGIDPQGVKAVDGGFREDLEVELWIWDASAEPPPPMPTVDPGQVEIIYEKKRPQKKRP